MKKGDYVRATRRLSLKETNQFTCFGILEGKVISTKPHLVIEYDTGEGKMQVRISDSARNVFEVIKEAEEE
ncbi:MAG: hypothetical protein ABIL39_10775 [candidate division WOR-3 bacterium]